MKLVFCARRCKPHNRAVFSQIAINCKKRGTCFVVQTALKFVTAFGAILNVAVAVPEYSPLPFILIQINQEQSAFIWQ